MLNMNVSINTDRWPLVTVVVTHDSFVRGKVVSTQQVQYDVAYSKAEEMVHNALRPMVTELINRRKEGIRSQQQQP